MTEPSAAARERAREIIGNVNSYAEDDGELSISAFGPLSNRIAAAKDAEIERLKGELQSAITETILRAERCATARANAIKGCVEKAKTVLRTYEMEFRRKTNSATNIVDYVAIALESLLNDKKDGQQPQA